MFLLISFLSLFLFFFFGSVKTGIGISRIELGNFDSDTFTVYRYCAAAVFDQLSVVLCTAVFMDLLLILFRFGEKGWGTFVGTTSFSEYIFVIVCVHGINISRGV